MQTPQDKIQRRKDFNCVGPGLQESMEACRRGQYGTKANINGPGNLLRVLRTKRNMTNKAIQKSQGWQFLKLLYCNCVCDPKLCYLNRGNC